VQTYIVQAAQTWGLPLPEFHADHSYSANLAQTLENCQTAVNQIAAYGLGTPKYVVSELDYFNFPPNHYSLGSRAQLGGTNSVHQAAYVLAAL